ncbi:M4 family metallopeptidase [Dyadobacter jiangsuensis]|uniref:Putative secreted protein (Por secretion system target) n=1 Tax=Dyadobacter jiangsuensis TaxID=1591085 RepID=A0A2P8FPF2_9BACT|nr:M4 family metallopeptidase [Dyadobacter jiangsuensis]PSL23610.1 putative secreted protein (Por secretion system target) [Dyadobacter jiangsuensis]
MKNTLLTACWLLLGLQIAWAQVGRPELNAFTSRTGARPTVDQATNALSFLRFPSQRAYPVAGNDVSQKAAGFITGNRAMLGMQRSDDDFRFRAQHTDAFGFQHVTLEQTYQGVPVFDGTYKFHFNKNLDLTAVNGNLITNIKVNVIPELAQHEAEAIAVAFVEDQLMKKTATPLRAEKSALYIFQKGLVQGYNGEKSLVYEVEVKNDGGIREFLYIDAHSGALVEQFTGVHGIQRKLYETSVSAPNLRWQEGDTFPGSLDIWQQSEVQSAGFIYNLMKNSFGMTSYNGADAPMITINNNPLVGCPNANWDGVTANYCTETASDDVVAHEWAHAYTEYTSGLVYGWQAGALNEAFSDIWGEVVDQLDIYMDDGESNLPRTGCGSSNRWQMGEKASAFGGALRDMWSPTCFGQPGKVSDPQYWCAANDNGGVHINSGVLNHAFALLVDGGTYNGQTITGIGITKASHIFWRAQSVYMTRTTDFAAVADMLEDAVQSLSGQPLLALTTNSPAAGASGLQIDANDATQLAKVIQAVELRAETGCVNTALLKPAPALCEGAKEGTALYFESFESGLGGFTTSFQTTSGTWEGRSWVQADAPGGRSGKVAFGIDYPGGNCINSFQQGLIRMESPAITIPAGTAGNLAMAFDHYVATEEGMDGGNIKYSINGGAWTIVPATAFTANPYNMNLTTSGAGNNNPLQGQQAFSGSDGGTIAGSWGQSQVNLSALSLLPGQTIRFRFEMGTDACGAVDGWYIDNLRVYTCASTPAVHFLASEASVNESEATISAGCLNYIDKIVTVLIDKAPTQPVTVTLNTPGGSAKQGATADYTISPTSFSLSAASPSQNIVVRIYNDAYVEGTETITLSYALNANGGNGYAATDFQNFQLSITDDDLTPGIYTDVLLDSDFDNGPGDWQVRNGGNSDYTWSVTQYSDAGLDAQRSPFFFVNSNTPQGNAILIDDYLESPAVNTSGRENILLTFSQAWLPFIGSYPETGTIEVWDGNAWQLLLTQNEATGKLGDILTFTADVRNIVIPAQYANANMKVRFRFVANSERWWAVDNVKISASRADAILTAVNTGNADQQYLGPNETAFFYDPSTGNIMAKIKNLSAHDYGCTTVEVDRAGTDAAPFSSFQVTNKTFKVTPANNNPNGNYEITLYYKSSELPTFNGTKIKSMCKREGGIPAGTGTSVFVDVQSAAAMNTDYAFTSTFTTGFSGFALSDAPVGSALPVTLISFDGRNTPEGNRLEWRTSAEQDNAYFAVEKSANGRSFVETGRVTGAGNSSVKNRYHFTDIDFPAGITYYRLKQVDTDGKFAYSKIIAIDAQVAGSLKFYPNPLQSMLSIELPDQRSGFVSAELINTSGQKVLVFEKIALQNGKLQIPVGKLAAGVYQIVISGDGDVRQISVFKQ